MIDKKLIIKIIIGTSILFTIIGIVSAADGTDIFKAPNTLQAVGTNSFVDQQGHNIMIIEYNDANIERWFQNDTSYLVKKYNETCYYAVSGENDCYLLETVEKDGAQYIVASWTPNGQNEAKIIQNNMEEFNKINQLTPNEGVI